MRDVGDAVCAGQIVAIRQPGIENGEKPLHLAQITCLHRRQFFRPIMAEQIGLAHHRPQPANLQHQPLQGFGAATRIGGQQLAGFFCQPDEDGTRFHYGEIIVDQAWHLAVGVQFQELGPLLLALGQIERLNGIA